MEDSEGTPANVAASISLAEEANVPKNDVSVREPLLLESMILTDYLRTGGEVCRDEAGC